MDRAVPGNSKSKVKKPFDKKKWRERKYSNKYKVQKWEEKRKRVVLREYYKELKTVKPKSEIPAAHDDSLQDGSSPTKKKKLSAMRQAQLEFEQKKQEKQQRQAEAEKRKAEREEALKKYREKKAERFKRLSKKTKKGQPIMKDRLEMLLEKIQRQCANDNK